MINDLFGMVKPPAIKMCNGCPEKRFQKSNLEGYGYCNFGDAARSAKLFHEEQICWKDSDMPGPRIMTEEAKASLV